MQNARQAIAKAEHRIHQRHQRLYLQSQCWEKTLPKKFKPQSTNHKPPAIPTRTSSSSDRPQNRPTLAFLCLVSSQKEHRQFFCHWTTRAWQVPSWFHLWLSSHKWPFINTLSTNPGVKVVPSAQVHVDGWPPEPQRFLDNDGTMSGCGKSMKTFMIDLHWLLERK